MPVSYVSRHLSLITLLLCTAMPAVAQNSIPVIEITHGTIVPNDNQLYGHPQLPWGGSLTVPSLAQRQQQLAQTPGSVKLIPAEHYAKKYSVSLKDTLSGTPGVFVQQRYGEEVRLSIRGSGLGRGNHLRGITLLQDGIPINLADGSGDFQELDPLSSRETEIFKGANGLPYSATLGGAINQISPTGHTAPDRNEARIEGGSFGTLRAHESSARVYGDTDVYASVTAMTANGYRDQSAQQKLRFNGNIGQRLGDNAETRFYVSAHNLQQEVPGTLTLRNALDHPTMAPVLNRTNHYARNINSIRLANQTSFIIGQELLSVGAYSNFKNLVHPIFQVLDQQSQTYGGFAELSGHTTLSNHRDEHSLRVNVISGKTDALQFTNVRGSRGTKTADSDQLASQFDAYGENRFFVTPQTSLVTGLQYVYALRDFTNNINQANNARQTFAAVNPRVGMVYDVQKDAQIFGNVSRSSEAPTYSELVQAPLAGFVPLDMQTAWTAELGTRGKSGRAAWDLTAYRAWVDNELLNFTVNPATPAATFNAGRTVHQGLELGFDWDVGKDWILPAKSGDKLVLRQIYNLNDFRFDHDPQYGNNRIAGAPLHEYRAELRYAHDGQWSVTPNIEAVPGGGYVDHANNLKAPGYAIVGLNADVALQKNVTFFIDTRNLLDKHYVSNYSATTNANSVGTAVFYPGEGRSVFAGLKVSF